MSKKLFVLAFLVMVLSAVSTAEAHDFQIKQFKAAKILYFLAAHQAFAVFSLNPLRPTDVINIRRSEVTAYGRDCFPGLVEPGGDERHAAAAVAFTVSVATGGSLGATAELKHILEAEFEGRVNIAEITQIRFAPLEMAVLPTGTWSLSLEEYLDDDTEACQRVGLVLREGMPDHMLVTTVFYGPARYKTTVVVSGGAKAHTSLGPLGKPIAVIVLPGPLRVLDGATAKFKYHLDLNTLFGTSEAVPQAIRPAFINADAAARIAYYLQGKRGAELEALVRAAITTSEPGIFEPLVLWIQELMGDLETQYDALFTGQGDQMIVAAEVSAKTYRSIGIAAAAIELTRTEDLAEVPAPSAHLETVARPELHDANNDSSLNEPISQAH